MLSSFPAGSCYGCSLHHSILIVIFFLCTSTTIQQGDNSVTNEYCSNPVDLDSIQKKKKKSKGPEFHQKVYVKNKHCKVDWYAKAYSPMDLSYSNNKCTYGYDILTCTKGPCEHPSPPLVTAEHSDDDDDPSLGPHHQDEEHHHTSSMIRSVVDEMEHDVTNFKERLWKRRVRKVVHHLLHDVVRIFQ